VLLRYQVTEAEGNDAGPGGKKNRADPRDRARDAAEGGQHHARAAYRSQRCSTTTAPTSPMPLSAWWHRQT